ncbi:helix-turn-helix domain-containing protein [uncultured Dialister sp.]|jgi:transcriptional regulator with XRE-family HTH domain|uniref:helix-turn-helix domain-containing protein n=1 Tax=uncultured Dialister sp. TaxID=278064 RepID=UPI0025D7DFBF|nr:helix-turn-helix transcriptional regulator [uncultured Dialister sp.]
MDGADAVWPKRLKYLRQSNNLSQTDVAKVLHCSQAAYGMYELGKRKISADKLLVLAQYYHVSVDYLVGLKDEV